MRSLLAHDGCVVERGPYPKIASTLDHKMTPEPELTPRKGAHPTSSLGRKSTANEREVPGSRNGLASLWREQSFVEASAGMAGQRRLSLDDDVCQKLGKGSSRGQVELF